MKHIKTISEFHEYVNLPKPQHPPISVIDVVSVPHADNDRPDSMALDFYSITIKKKHNVKVQYGHQ